MSFIHYTKLSLSAAVIWGFAFIANTPIHAQTSECNWTGTWTTQYGDLRVIHAGNKFVGDYGPSGTITGSVNADCKVNGRYKNSNGATGAFEFTKDDQTLNGRFGSGNNPVSYPWAGSLKSNGVPILVTAPYPRAEMMRQTITQGLQHPTQQHTYSQPLTTHNQALTQPLKKSSADQLREARRKAAVGTTVSREAYLKKQEQEARLKARRETVRESNFEKRRKNAIDTLESGTWRVSLEGMCALGTSEGDVLLGIESEDVFGIGWIRARVIDKSQFAERQIDLSPIGGFTRVNGDKERVWEIRPSGRAISLWKTDDHDASCQPFTTKNHFRYRVDFKRYGYANVHDFLAESRNRIDVMFKLSEKDTIRHDSLGTRRVATSFKDSNFCVQCDPKQYFGRRNPNKTSGDGVISGFTDGETNIHVYYGIQPEGTVLNDLYDRPDIYAKKP